MVQGTIIHGQDRVEIGKTKCAVEAVPIALQPTDPDKVRLLFQPFYLAKELTVVGILLEEDVQRLNFRDERAIGAFLVQELLAKINTFRITQTFKSDRLVHQ